MVCMFCRRVAVSDLFVFFSHLLFTPPPLFPFFSFCSRPSVPSLPFPVFSPFPTWCDPQFPPTPFLHSLNTCKHITPSRQANFIWPVLIFPLFNRRRTLLPSILLVRHSLPHRFQFIRPSSSPPQTSPFPPLPGVPRRFQCTSNQTSG